jgi:hypothetical protein
LPYVGARAPEALGITITAASGCDLSPVTSAEITTKNPKGTALAWAWSVSNATVSQVYLLHPFADDGNDAKVEGKYTISGWLFAGTERVCRIKPITVPFDKYG